MYFPESSSVASVIFSVLPEDSSYDRYKHKHTEVRLAINVLYR